jgi:hypothetical protein
VFAIDQGPNGDTKSDLVAVLQATFMRVDMKPKAMA